ncbi:MAG: hypothetical protein K9G76_12315 [Bacteroidales bacterium]|nr:hypothetical protein [Bacteroidales bacterium]MCF8405313.1 hypothetical protein [Bacteroidales bacterium]
MKHKIYSLRPAHIVIAGLAFILLVTFFSYVRYHRYTQGLSIVISSDAEGYYQYLPAVFIKKDIFNQPYSFPLENGKLFNKYTYGVALMELPFFLLAHMVALVFDLPIAGKFTSYAFGVIMAGAFYTFMGLLLIFKLLRRRYNVKVVWLTVGAVFFATNLVYYTYLEPGASHAFAFFLVSWIIYLVPKFYRSPGWKRALLLALAIGILALIRLTHLMILAYLLLYKVNSTDSLKANFLFLTKHLKYLLLIPAFVILLYIPQHLYWYSLTGRFILNPYEYSYVEESFSNILNPKIGLVLFGSTGGWLVLTPLMIFALFGIIMQIRKKTGSPWPVILITTLTIYMYSSWWHPTLAGSFGHRGFVDIYALLAFPLAYLINSTKISTRKLMFRGLVAVFALLAFINIRLTFLYQYWWWDVEWGWTGYFKTLAKVFFIDVGDV